MRCCARPAAQRLFERSDASVRGLEGLPELSGWLRGDGDTAAHDPRARLAAYGRRGPGPQDRLLPRPARQPVAASRSGAPVRLRRVLNCYSYTGGFSVAALAGGATQVTSIDSSAPALAARAAHVAAQRFRCAAPHDAGRRCQRQPARLRSKRAGASMPSCSTRPSSRPPLRTPSAPRAPTRTSTGWRSSCWRRRAAVHLLLLGRHRRGPVPQDRRRCRPRRRRGRCLLQRLAAAADHPTTLEFPESDYLTGLELLVR